MRLGSGITKYTYFNNMYILILSNQDKKNICNKTYRYFYSLVGIFKKNLIVDQERIRKHPQ